MTLLELFILAVGLSMDAFAASVCTGLALPGVTAAESALVGAYFGAFQSAMPLAGYIIASRFANQITSFDHWIAFALLFFLGTRMIVGSFKKEDLSDKKASLQPSGMLPLAVATSIDALAVGVSLAFLKVSIIPAVLFIGAVTFSLSMLGVKLGALFGAGYKAKAEFAGGGILVLIGLKILLEHTGILSF